MFAFFFDFGQFLAFLGFVIYIYTCIFFFRIVGSRIQGLRVKGLGFRFRAQGSGFGFLFWDLEGSAWKGLHPAMIELAMFQF